MRPGWLKAEQVEQIYSVSGCISENFADYVKFWKHNGYWLFDSPEIIRNLAAEHLISLETTSLFFCEVYEFQYDGAFWRGFAPEPSLYTNVLDPLLKTLEGFDIATFRAGNAPECSPLSCNSLAEEIQVNRHCLLDNFEDAELILNGGAAKNSEPGPYRIFAVYSVPW